ncbi:uncharacterized protein LOC106654660 [Trichogramma pretiosum]|uniref:uncharacterized protein LOC106654660 n=1 Tax=Trichogramma pretiosum TaxID=7493 RepID=UPI0006C9B38C|nr:uncharacterized protein LOC106654660 [Trichogramma pretiosum]
MLLIDMLEGLAPWLVPNFLYDWSHYPFNIQLKPNTADFIKNRSININDKVLILYILVASTTLHLIFKKMLNQYLRRTGHGLLHRNRISTITWTYICNFMILVYTIFLWHYILNPEMNVIIMKSFYIHHSLILLSSGYWQKAFSNMMFMLFLFGIPRQSLRPPVSTMFLLKSIDSLIFDIVRILYLRWPVKVKTFYARMIYGLYCIYWTYAYIIDIPLYILLPYNYQSLNELLLICLWFISQYFDFVWFDFIRHCNTDKFLERCLFPKPSFNRMYLSKIVKRHKYMQNRKYKQHQASHKKELWQTLKCALTVKKKINRLRKVKKSKEERDQESPMNDESQLD